ncbi:penicillin-binding protein 2 [Marinihelvus fidelis]|uniref:Peptidoglycan D,D-transpeptidase MrdA n=1 Tax=Marinihelvus fidelis TaxID=2613842 RepID=A0A5N0TCL1_9GAMM|nr:penicillin-binding protein 2 [Marinihelvus fidelis]KAA9131019.1 penicillin-binding protein 2 [Marinihelvus fidelis]
MNATPLNRPLKDDAAEASVFRGRAIVGFIGILVLTTALLSRYLWLQVIHHQDFTTRSESNRVQVRTVAPTRGLIYDRRGRPVAENRPAFRLQLIPEKVGDLEATLDALAELVEIDEEDRARFHRARGRYREFESVPLRFALDEAEMARFAVNRHRFEGVEAVPYLSRHYPYGELLTHVLGYVGRVDERDLANVDVDEYRGTTHIGKLGVERSWEGVLHGHSGMEKVETNAVGRVLDVLEREAPVPGSDLVLSIDIEVQRAAWEALGDQPGAVVAIDPRDGAVIAMVSKPAFDPNLFVDGIRQASYEAILAQPGKPLFNRALSGGYEPGSTLKPFVGLAGLELGVYGREHRVFSSGAYRLPNYDRPYRDWKRGGHGWVDIRGALEESVNTYFYDMAVTMGIDAMHDYLAQFGFGQATGIDLPGETSGVLPSRDWKRGRYNEPWYPGETVIAGIGQGFNVTSPLQLSNAVAALVNGGQRWEPRVVFAAKHADDDEVEEIRAPLAYEIPVVNEGNWEWVREGMRRVVNGTRGTAREIGVDAPWEIAGKTGTAQVFTLARGQEYDNETVAAALRHHALFVAFAPYDSPRIAVAVVAEHGGAGSLVAAPMARTVIDAWLSQEALP